MTATLMTHEEVPDAPSYPAALQAFVVLHAGLGKWKRGDVLTSIDLPIAELNRHLGLKSVRLAYPAEATMKHVELPDDVPSMSYEQRLAEKDQQIMSLQAQIRDAQDAMQRSQPVNHTLLSAERENHAALNHEKDRQFSDLHNRWKGLDETNRVLEQRNRDVEQQLVEAQQKIKLMESSAATPSQEELRGRIAALSGQVPPGSDAASVEARKPRK